jgi:hypothetical protein
MRTEKTILFKGLWREQRELLNKRFPFLNNEELRFKPGNSKMIFENLKLKLGLTNAEFMALLKSL